MIQLNKKILKKFQRSSFKKGFTLVEVLIVMIIIGILAGGMTLVAGGSRDIAEATRIVSDLKSIKVATLMWIVDDPNGVDPNIWEEKGHSSLDQYLDKPILDNNKYKFETITLNDREVWLLGYDLSGARNGVVKKLADQAESAGLFEKDKTKDTLALFKGGVDSDKVVYVIVQ